MPDSRRCIVSRAQKTAQKSGGGGGRSRPPLLFVHGAFIGAWCWAEHFLPYFAARGHDAWAVNLRGHGEGERTTDLESVDDYVADLLLAIEDIGEAPVLIGHSMGAIVVQRAARRAAALGLSLLAPVPPQGLLGSSFLLAANSPELFNEINLLQAIDGAAGSPELLRKAIFSGHLPADDVLRHLRRMRHESQRALFDLSWPQYFWIENVSVPVQVIGAADDLFFPPPLVEQTARLHGVEAEIVPDAAHALMLDSAWQEVAQRIERWLDRAVAA